MTEHASGHDQRARDLLRGRAGELYRELAALGSMEVAGRRFGPSGADRTALDLLVELGLVSIDGDDPPTAVPEDPVVVQSRLVAPLGRAAAELLAESTEWSEALTELGHAFRRDLDRTPVTEIHGLNNINRFLQTVVGDAEEELLTAQPAGGRAAATLRTAAERDIRALERGVQMRTLYQHSARRSVATREYVERVTAHGGQVRTLDEFFNRLIVVDRRLAVVPGSGGTRVAIAIREPNLVAYLADIFERYWERAHDFVDRNRPTERAIADDVHNMTVRMLIEGHSDNASAKRMGVSTRTFAGYVAALKAAYGAETRFQLGHAMGMLGRRGTESAAPGDPADQDGSERRDDAAD